MTITISAPCTALRVLRYLLNRRVAIISDRDMSMKGKRKKKPKPRLPIDAVLKLRSHPVTTRKGEKGYDRKRLSKQNRKILREAMLNKITEQNN